MRGLEDYIKKLPDMYCRILGIEKTLDTSGADVIGAKLIKYTVNNYTELLTIADQEIDDFAFVIETEGTAWLPGGLGGDYYGKGLYIWTGTIWAEANIEINTVLQSLLEEHKIEFITADYILPDSTNFEGDVVVKNVSATDTFIVGTVVLDKLEGEDTQEIFPGESFTIQKYLPNDYRII